VAVPGQENSGAITGGYNGLDYMLTFIFTTKLELNMISPHAVEPPL